MLVSKAEVSSRVSTETRAVIDGYQRMVTSMVTGKTGPSGRSRGCALWCDLAALKRNADDGDQHPQPDPAHRRLFFLLDVLVVTL